MLPGLRSLYEILKGFNISGIQVLLSGVKKELRVNLDRYNISSVLEESMIFEDFNEALAKAYVLAGRD